MRTRPAEKGARQQRGVDLQRIVPMIVPPLRAAARATAAGASVACARAVTRAWCVVEEDDDSLEAARAPHSTTAD
jgi:hypothetical protein